MSTFSLLGMLLLGGGLIVGIIVVIVVIVAVCANRSSKQETYQAYIPQPVEQQETASQQTAAEPQAETVYAVEQPERTTLPEAIKNHRIRCGMTQEQVAEALEVSRQAVSKWETGGAEPSTSNLLALARLFGISAAELLEGIE